MLRKTTRIQGLPVAACDGEIGAVEDLYFDEARWAVRYLVIDTGGWLTGRKVLVSPCAVQRGQWPGDAIPVDLTRTQVEESPPLGDAGPVSRGYEMALASYYGHPYYWTGPYLWGRGAWPLQPGASRREPPGGEARELASAAQAEEGLAEAHRCHLRSCGELIGYRIEARDGAIGQLDDLLVDDETWGIPYLVVDKRAWLPGGQVLVLPDAVSEIDWATRSLRLTITREAVKASPDYRT